MSAVDGLIQRLEGTLATTSDGPRMSGRVRRTIGGSLEVTGFDQGLGAECLVLVNDTEVPAQVVGFSDEATFLMPLADITGVRPGAPVRAAEALRLPEPAQLMNRVIDGMGRPLDGKPLAQASAAEDILRHGGFNPLERRGVAEPLDVGVRALNALFTIGVGQRIGVFAGSGVGKSVLLGMMARFTKADAVVVGLIGERGREVVEFIDDNLGPEGRAKSVVVASPADDSPVLRIRAATLATRIAHQLRAAGKHVLLVMDSLTRVAQAQREIGLSLGEPPTTKGYPPSVFALLPKLVEQAGNLNNFTGSVTAFYTVLAEGDDQQDPIADAARAILDGHVVLSRSLADAGHFPAIDVEASISRLMPKLVDETHLKAAMDLKGLWSRYAQQQDLISVGAYAAGSDPLTDRAIALRPKLLEFLKQRSTERADLAVSRLALDHLMTEPADLPSADVVGTAQLPELTSA